MTNYVKVDEECCSITVYDQNDEIEPVTYTFDDPRTHIDARRNAEAFALTAAQELGCEWGTNYP